MKRHDLITVNEAARLKGLTRQAIHAAIEQGRLEHVIVSVSVKAKRVTPEALAAFQPNEKRRAAGLMPKTNQKLSP